MRNGRVLGGLAGLGVVVALGAGCAADELESDDWVEDDDAAEIAIAGRWIPTGAVTSAADRQYARYDDGPSWSGGRNCGGSLLAGTRAVGDYLRANFRGVSSYDGYVCRANTANTSRTSMHGTGRALDVYVPTRSGGAADNTVGDAVAAWLITNAASLGVQLVIWDRSSWNASRASGAKLRAYGGPHPHNDHLHVELNADGAARRTAWFRDRSVAPAPAPAPAPTPAPAPAPAPAPVPAPAAVLMRVNVSALNLRGGPGTSYGVLTSMPCGSTVTVVNGPYSGWYDVRYGAVRGWASGNFLLAAASFSSSVCGR